MLLVSGLKHTKVLISTEVDFLDCHLSAP